MSLEENKAIAIKLNDEIYNKGNLDIIDELLGEDYVQHPGMRTREQSKEGRKEFLANTPGRSVTLEDAIAEGDRVTLRWTQHIPHSWEYAGIAPTHKMLHWHGISIYRIVDGKIVEDWAVVDQLGFFKQWGYTPDMEQVQEGGWE